VSSHSVISTNPLMLFNQLSAAHRSAISAAMGFLFYGSWAFVVNYDHGIAAGIKAAIVQGSYSFILTFTMTMLLEAMFRFASQYIRPLAVACTITILVCCAIVFSGSWLVNYLAGTPEILKTVILGYIIGGAYSTVYVLNLAQLRNA